MDYTKLTAIQFPIESNNRTQVTKWMTTFKDLVEENKEVLLKISHINATEEQVIGVDEIFNLLPPHAKEELLKTAISLKMNALLVLLSADNVECLFPNFLTEDNHFLNHKDGDIWGGFHLDKNGLVFFSQSSDFTIDLEWINMLLQAVSKYSRLSIKDFERFILTSFHQARKKSFDDLIKELHACLENSDISFAKVCFTLSELNANIHVESTPKLISMFITCLFSTINLNDIEFNLYCQTINQYGFTTDSIKSFIDKLEELEFMKNETIDTDSTNIC